MYRPGWPLAAVQPSGLDWVPYEGGLVEIGHAGEGLAFDNEGPRHRQWLAPYALASRLATHGEWLAFMLDGGYEAPRWWLAAGWDWLRPQRIQSPLYWRRTDAGGWQVFTLHGLVPLDPHTPVTHVSVYEADAFARWSAAQQGLPLRLATEAEWEHAAAPLAELQIASGNFVETGALHPVPLARPGAAPQQMFGDVREWTGSSYEP